MLAIDSPVSAYVVLTTSTGEEIKWQVPSASFFVNTSGSPAGSLVALQNSMQTWSDVPTSSFVFLYAGATTSLSHGDFDGQNIVTFAPMGNTGVLAENNFWYNSVTGQLVDSDIRFNTTYSWSASGAPGLYDVQNIATHELGHSLALADLYGVTDAEKTMYGFGELGETRKRTLDPDDIAGIAHLYPTGGGGTVGDFDGDGNSDVAVWRPGDGTWWIQRSSDGGVTVTQWGASTDVSVPGDYDNDRRTDIAIWRPSEGTWWIKRSSDGGVTVTQWGTSGDVPAPGDYDGDGQTDLAVWRPGDGSWWIKRSSDGGVTVTQWGTLGDVPITGSP